MPDPRRCVERIGGLPGEIGAGLHDEPEVVAHADIEHQRTAIAELAGIAQQTGRGLHALIVEPGGERETMRRHHDIADFQHGAGAVGGNLAHLDPAFGFGR